MRTINEALEWFAKRKQERKPLYDFCRPIGRPCADCGYPMATGNYRLKVIDCPEHMPAHWKYHERKAQQVAKAIDQAETIIKEVSR